jgi:uncharacterized hydrophobic protein (TIGR00271 family)
MIAKSLLGGETDAEEPRPFRILVGIGDPEDLVLLLAVAVPLARGRQGRVTPLYVGRGPEAPTWLRIDREMRDVVDEPAVVRDEDISGGILTFARRLDPDLLLLHWEGEASRGRYLLGRTLDPVIQNAPCDVAVVKVDESPSTFVNRMSHLHRILVPVGGGENAILAMDMAMDMRPEEGVTALRVAQENLGLTAISSQWSALQQAIEPWVDDKQLRARVVQAPGVMDGILREATEGEYDLVFVGATQESLLDRLLFGNLPQEIATRLTSPTVIVRRYDPSPVATLRRIQWRFITILPQLTLDERIGIYRQVQRSARGGVDFYVMIILAGAIASLGLLLNSPAVIIGAMVIAPFMSALIGVSLGIVQGDFWLLRTSLRTTLLGTLAGFAVGVLIGAPVPGGQVTAEMLSRGSPTLLDLGVALASGGAAAYATSRKSVASALSGVAIAVALVPPLVTVGLALGASATQVSLGASLLFLTNMVSIVSAATVMFMWMGFRPTPQREKLERRTFQGGLITTTAMLLVITAVLAILTTSTIHRALVRDRVRRTLISHVETMPQVILADWEMQHRSEGVLLDVTVEAPRDIAHEEVVELHEELVRQLQKPVDITFHVIRTTRIELNSIGPSPPSAQEQSAPAR